MKNKGLLKTRKKQQGVAAIEFALVITLLLTVCFAIVSFGMLMWTQQKVSHIAGDTARFGLQQSILGKSPFDSSDPNGICESHAMKMVQADAILKGPEVDVTCMSKVMYCPLSSSEESSCVDEVKEKDEAEENYHRSLEVTIVVKVNGLPLVNMVQGLGQVISNNPDGWIPEKLSATSVVKITEL